MDRALGILTKKLADLHQKKAAELLSGNVSDDRYRSHLAYIQAIVDILKLAEQSAKEAREMR